MLNVKRFLIITSGILLTACINISGTKIITPVKSAIFEPPITIAYAPDPLASGKLDEVILETARASGFTVLPNLPTGTLLSDKTKLIISYTHRWKWDMTSYLAKFECRLYNATTGELLTIGSWDQPKVFGTGKSPEEHASGVVREMLSRVQEKK